MVSSSEDAEAAAKICEPEPDFSHGPPKVEGLKAAADLAKQLVTLSVAMIGLTITFLKDIVAPASPAGSREVSWPILTAWGGFTLCILAAIATMIGVCGSMTVLDRLAMGLPVKGKHKGFYDVYGNNVAIAMGVMQLSFVVAIAATIVGAILAR